MYKAGEKDVVHTIDDFLTFCSFLEEKAPVLSKRGVVLGKKDLFELNDLLYHKKDVEKPNYMQESYPVIDLMFNLALLGKLYKKSADEKGIICLVKTERKDEYDRLTIYERYVFLLETFYIYFDIVKMAQWESAAHLIDAMIEKIAEATPGEKLLKGAFSKNPDHDSIYSYVAVFVHYFSFFGICSYIPVTDQKRNPTRYDDTIAAVIPNEFGKALCSLLEDESIADWNMPWLKKYIIWDEKIVPGITFQFEFHCRLGAFSKSLQKKIKTIYEERKKAGYIPLFEFLQQIFPKGHLNQTVTKDINTISKGTYIFKVSLETGIWRKIAISYMDTLNDLHNKIQEAFDFGNDHLYAFYMKESTFSREAFYSPFSYEEPCASDAVLGEIGLYPGQKILYVFDFGDYWQFDVLLIKIDQDMELPKVPYIIESKGTAPDQYCFGDFADE
jgi:hypothetical protein